MEKADAAPKMLPYQSLRKQKRIDLVEQIPLRGPLSIYLEPTNVCNFKCLFCPESFADYKEKAGGLFQLSLDDFKAVAAQIKAIGTVKTLNFYMMGEPFGNRHLPEFVAIAKRDNIAERVIVTSNGTLIKPAKYREICESGLDYLRISIYGANEDTHKSNTQSTIKLARIKENVAGLKQFRDAHSYPHPYIYLKMIESSEPEENRQFMEHFSPIGDEAVIEPVMNWNDPDEGNLSGLDKDTLLSKEYFAQKKEVCPFPFYTMVIHSDLTVSVCCVDWDKKTNVGELRRESLLDVWTGAKLRDFQLKHVQRRRAELGSCKNCTFLHTAPDNLDAITEAEFLGRTGPGSGIAQEPVAPAPGWRGPGVRRA